MNLAGITLWFTKGLNPMNISKLLFLFVFSAFAQYAFSASNECGNQKYHLVFAVNNDASVGGVAGYSEGFVTSCSTGLTAKEINNYRIQVAKLLRAKNSSLKDDQVILVNYQPVASDNDNPTAIREIPKINLL